MYAYFIVLFPSHHPVFDHLRYVKMEGKPGIFYHVNDISVYLKLHVYNIRKWRPICTQGTAAGQCCKHFYIDQGEFVAMKTLSGCRGPGCDKTVLNTAVLTRKMKNGTFVTTHFCV